MNPQNKILLTFDVEEFDLPLEFKLPINTEEQFSIGKSGTDIIEKILLEANIETTLFTTANFALQFPADIKRLSQKHEIASHSFYHTGFKKEDLLNSRLALEEITGKRVEGFRMPRLKHIELQWIKEAGYSYDASINPTYIPGRYNLRHLPRTVYSQEDLLRVPCSVTPNIRLPLFWLSFKNLPYTVYKMLALQTLRKDGYLSLYFHPWEFTDISQFKLPAYLKRQSGHLLQERIQELIKDLKQEGEFCSMNTFLQTKPGLISL